MKVLLIKPRVKYPIKNGDIAVPLGLLYIASYLRTFNPKIEVDFKSYRLEHFLGKERDLEKDFEDFNIIATGCVTAEYPDAIEMLKKAKELGKTTIIGGIFPTSNIKLVLNSGVVDYTIRGEGEVTFAELITALQNKLDVSKVKGISYIGEGQIINTPDRDLIKNLNGLVPAYDLAPMKDYVKLSNGAIYSARGCFKKCKFCTLNKHWRYKYRMRSIESVVREIKMLKSFGFERVHFKDEILTASPQRTKILFERLRREDLGLKYKGKSRIDCISPNLVDALLAGGLDTLHFGVESVIQDTLKSMDKEYDAKKISGVLGMVLKKGCKINPVYLFGWLGETPKTLKENAEFIENFGKQENVITYISFFTPHPGSEVGYVNNQDIQILTRDLNCYTHKLPVAVPKSLGENGLELMVETYNRISQHIGQEAVNPLIRPDYVQQLRYAPWKSR